MECFVDKKFRDGGLESLSFLCVTLILTEEKGFCIYGLCSYLCVEQPFCVYLPAVYCHYLLNHLVNSPATPFSTELHLYPAHLPLPPQLSSAIIQLNSPAGHSSQDSSPVLPFSCHIQPSPLTLIHIDYLFLQDLSVVTGCISGSKNQHLYGFISG